MSVEETTGDIFKSGCDVITIPVNLKGVMGKGLAKTFANRFPEFVSLYKTAIRDGYLRKNVSCLIAYKGHRFLMFPTKDDWRNPSDVDDIRSTLVNLKKSLKTLKIHSLALPALGCGCGGVDYSEIKKLVLEVMEGQETCKIKLYKPWKN